MTENTTEVLTLDEGVKNIRAVIQSARRILKWVWHDESVFFTLT